ncbi:MAG: Response regulator protein VraR [Bacteroidia bacterium]|nr:Response regulator protein VraR [Bacteroidia bacterium]
MHTIRLIIAMPSRLLATALADYIEERSIAVRVTGIACESKEIFTHLERMPSRVLLLDPYLPGLAPQIVCSRLKTEFPNLKIILMKNTNSNGRFNEAEKCRPAAIIGCDATPNELLELIQQTGAFFSHSRCKKPTPEDLQAPAAPAETETQAEKPEEPEEPLTPREKDIVNLIVRGHTAREIGFVLDISYNTARTHIRNLLTKLKLSSKVQLIAWHSSL